ncbi:MAG: hypothetical protein ABH803_00325 [Candidatus Micrarchaeota archaeon]
MPEPQLVSVSLLWCGESFLGDLGKPKPLLCLKHVQTLFSFHCNDVFTVFALVSFHCVDEIKG